MDRAINAPGHGNNVVDVLNATDTRYLKGEMEIIGKLVSKNTTNIGMIHSALNYFSIKFVDQCIHILNNKEIMNGPKGRTKMQKRQSQFKYQSRIYNDQSNSDVDHRGMKMRWNNKKCPSLNSINGKTSPY